MKYCLHIGLICVLLFAGISSLFAQNVTLKITTVPPSGEAIIQDVFQKQIFPSQQDAVRELSLISEKLALKGFIVNTYSYTINDSIVKATFELHQKVDFIHIHIDKATAEKLKLLHLDFKQQYPIRVKTDTLQHFMSEIVTHCKQLGYPFTKAYLKNISVTASIAYAELQIDTDQQRYISNVIVRGYEKFPKKFITKHLNLNRRPIYNENLLKQIENNLNTLPFIKQTQQPAMLFTKDSSTLYIYVEKKKNNSFEGVLGFSNTNTEKITLTGNVNLQVMNMADKGEKIIVDWRRIEKNTQTFNTSFFTPYIYNSNFSPTIAMSIFKNDSLFSNTTFTANVDYKVSNLVSLTGSFKNETSTVSEVLENGTNVLNYKKWLAGIGIQLFNTKPLPSEILPQEDFILKATYSVGKRTIENQIYQQDLISLAYNNSFLLGKNTLILKNYTEILMGEKLVENELYRIGGASNIRGFDEQQFITNKYSLFTTEYHLTSSTSSLYFLSDIAVINTYKPAYGTGIGFINKTTNNLFNICYVLGINDAKNINFKNSRIHIKMRYSF